MGEHAPLPPSSAEQWGHCSGSRAAQLPFPNVDTAETRHGVAGHWVMAEMLTGLKAYYAAGGTVENAIADCRIFLGLTAPNGVVVDAKCVEGAQIIVDDVAATCGDNPGNWVRLMVEQRVYMPFIHPENWGTLDVALPVFDRNQLFIWDYKQGHRECPARGNLQMTDYLGGLMQLFNIDGYRDQTIEAFVRIVQPYCYRDTGPIEEWRVVLSDLRGAFNQLKMKAIESFTAPTLSTGLWCRDCRARGICSAVRAAGYNFVDLVNQPYAMDSMNSADLAVERDILAEVLAVAKARLEAIEDDLMHRIQGGDTGSGLTLNSSAGRLEWTCPPAQAVALGKQFGVDISELAVQTPTQAKLTVPAKMRSMFEQVIKGFTRRPPGALKLVRAENSIGARAFMRKD